MNKQKLIERIEGLPYNEGLIVDTIKISRKGLLELVNQLDEPEKVKIPQMVVDWIKKCKTFKSFAVSLSFALQPSVWEANGLSGECVEWLMDAENQELFASAWLDGYDVEYEKRYKIYIKSTGQDLFNNKGNLHFMYKVHADNTGFLFTKSELEENSLGWVFDCPGIEIKEVKNE